MSVLKDLSIRIKLVIGFLTASVIPFLFVSIFAVVYFQGDKQADIINQLNSDLNVQTKFLKSNIDETLRQAEGLGFQNSTTVDALDKFFQNPPKGGDDVSRSIFADEYAAHFKQYLKGDIVRIMLIMNASDTEDRIIGEIVYSVKKQENDGTVEIIDDSLALKGILNNSLYLRSEDSNALSQAYYAGRSRKRSVLNEFSVFNGQSSFFISTPILQEEGFSLNIPNIDRSRQPKPAEDENNNTLGIVLLQIVPKSLQSTIGNYHGLGETYLVGENQQGQKVLRSSVTKLKSETGELLKQGEIVPQYVSDALTQTGLNTLGGRLVTHKNLEIEGVNWYLLADIDPNRVFAPVTNLRNLFLIIGLIGFIIILVVSIFLATTFSNPLKQLAKSLIEIKKTSDFSKRSKITGNDEIGQTITAVNELMESLQTAFGAVNSVMEAVARGDLSQRINGEYQGGIEELKEAINKSLDVLCHTMKKVYDVSEQVNSGSNELKSSAQVIADGTSTQAGNLEEISSSMDVVSTQSQDNNSNATNVQDLVSQTLEVVQRGNHQMTDMLQSMNKINDTSAKVTKVVKVIDEIAFQTNLLALNAAIEAARAGKYGKGFAVVAEEVRNLASRSAEAAKNTTELIENSTREIEQGVKKADQTAEVLGEISSDVTRANDLIGDIAVASSEQVSSIKEINRGLGQINNIVQQNSAVSEETAASSAELSNQSTELQSLINQFKLTQNNTHVAGIVSVKQEQTQQPSETPAIKPPLKITTPPGRMISLDDDDFGPY